MKGTKYRHVSGNAWDVYARICSSEYYQRLKETLTVVFMLRKMVTEVLMKPTLVILLQMKLFSSSDKGKG
jgi:hypothetical protein